MDEEVAHDGDEGDFVGLAGGAQAAVEGLQDGVGAGGAKGGHEEGAAHVEAAATDGALSAEGAAVAIKRSQAGQGRDLIFGAGAELGQRGQKRRGGGGADAGTPGTATRRSTRVRKAGVDSTSSVMRPWSFSISASSWRR